VSSVSFVPKGLALSLYAGDGASLKLTVTDKDKAPIDLVGNVTAQIRKRREDPGPLTSFSVQVASNVATLVLTGAQTTQLGQFSGFWDCQWVAPGSEPVTLIQGQVQCTLDVTR
jgi:hypothetical protein